MYSELFPCFPFGFVFHVVSLVLTSHWLAFELLMTGKLGLDVTNVIWLGLGNMQFTWYK